MVDHTALTPVDVRDLLPHGGVEGILGLADDLDRMGRAGAGLSRRVETVTGLRTGELQVLATISAGADHPRAVAAATGEIVEAVEATVDSLLQRGLVGRHAHVASGDQAPALLHLTAPGRAALEQAEGVQLRLADALAAALGAERTSRLRETLRAVADVMESGDLPTPTSSAAR